MSTPEDLAQAVQGLAAKVRDLSDDPGEQVRLLAALASFVPATASSGAVGAAMDAMREAVGALCRRAAVVALARASAASMPASYEEAVALRDLVCDLLQAEILTAGDLGDDASGSALRALRTAVAEDLNRRSANLARLREVRTGAPLPALVHAYRLYGDITRRDEVAAYAAAQDPNVVPTSFRARDR